MVGFENIMAGNGRGECVAGLGNRIELGIACFSFVIQSYDNWRMIAKLFPIIEISYFYIGDFKI